MDSLDRLVRRAAPCLLAVSAVLALMPAPASAYDQRAGAPDGWSSRNPASDTDVYRPGADRRRSANDIRGWPGRNSPPPQHPGDAQIGYQAAPTGESSPAPGNIERGELAPVMAGDGSSLPHELWAGIGLDEIERLLSALTIPPRSPALHNLWRRLVSADVATPGAGGNEAFEALRMEALYRSGLIGEITRHVSQRHAGEQTALVAVLAARSEIGMGRRTSGCAIARRLSGVTRDVPRALRAEAMLIAGYCSAADGNAAQAGLMAGLAREHGALSSTGLAALDAIALGAKPEQPNKETRLGLVDYRILELTGALPPADLLVRSASPALLATIGADPAAAPQLRLQAAEAAARLNVIDPAALGALYRELAARPETSAVLSDAAAASRQGPDPAARRALLYAHAVAERTPFKRVRLIRSLLDSARAAGLYGPALVLAATLCDGVGPVPEIGWFAETAIESYLAAGNFADARRWIRFAASLDGGNSGLSHWMALADIGDPAYPEPRGGALSDVERQAVSGRFPPDLLHRLATVLDALAYQVPIPLWEQASRTPQPTGGHLPETGVLSRLQAAAKDRAFGRTVLLVMQTLGPDGAEGANMIALGDAIRALKRAGLEPDARRMGLEALLGAWPRATWR
ncbi:MAG: hypothetical protein AB7U49_07010 [Hyphomicrobiaceae bacterium]